ncbi:MRP family domain-containing protein [Babesia ovis]|uniref:MRP family domain-containing protein n=1 Tax=Babesia ovis TaxID=5869 RepID=A0A9W5WTE0_BABOV|nr:MRP family domain-containing protein [Babesia ovis]
MHWNVSHIIAVHGCKGGVGKSTVTAGLALALKGHGCSVGICDLDIHGPNIAYILGTDNSYVRWKQVKLEEGGIKYDTHLTTTPKVRCVDSNDNNDKSISCCNDVCHDFDFTSEEPATTCLLEPKEVYGIKVMSFSFIKSERELGYAAFRGPMIDQIASELVFKTDWGQLDYLILDLPPGTGDIIITLMEDITVSALVAVTTPHQLSVNDLLKGVKLFQDHDVPIACLVENMSYFICNGCDKLHCLFGPSHAESAAKSLAIDTHICLPIMTCGTDFVKEFSSNKDALQKFGDIANVVISTMARTKTHGNTMKSTPRQHKTKKNSAPCSNEINW